MKSKTIEIGKHIITIKDGDITCDCEFGIRNPGNWKRGENLCKHIKQVVKEDKENGKK